MVVIDELQAEKAAVQPRAFDLKAEEEEQKLNITGIVVDDDEQNLLGSESVNTAVFGAQGTRGGDGIDSASEPEGEDGRRGSPGGGPSPVAGEEVAPARPEAGGDGSSPMAPPPQRAPNHGKADKDVASSLDRFFGDESAWRQVASEVASAAKSPGSSTAEVAVGTTASFWVQVPQPYPGVQYRKSMCLEDKCERYAPDGQIVRGIVQEGGEWLRIDGNDLVFLPMRVGNILILRTVETPVPAQTRKSNRKSAKPDDSPSWWSCCAANDMETSEVVVDAGQNRFGATGAIGGGAAPSGGSQAGSSSPAGSASAEAGRPSRKKGGSGRPKGPRSGAGGRSSGPGTR